MWIWCYSLTRALLNETMVALQTVVSFFWKNTPCILAGRSPCSWIAPNFRNPVLNSHDDIVSFNFIAICFATEVKRYHDFEQNLERTNSEMKHNVVTSVCSRAGWSHFYDSAPVPKFFNPGLAIFQIWESDSAVQTSATSGATEN